jgi:hypothetical protein
MKKLPLVLALIFLLHAVHAQMSYKMQADSIYITNGSRPAELNLENSTKSVKGFLYNKGNGRTEFRKAVKLNDSMFLFGEDTLMMGGNAAWSFKGNAGTNAATNFIGTTDNQSFIMRTNNTERLRIDSIGNVGIGNLAPAARLHIAGSNTPLKIDMDWPGKLTVQASDAFMKFEGNGDHFMHFQIKDSSAGRNAGTGMLMRNDVNHGLQICMGSTTNYFVPAAALIRSTGTNGLKISSDIGRINFQIGTVTPTGLADTANIKMTIDSFGVRIRKADLVSYDTATYQTVVMDKSSGRLFKANNTGAGAGWSFTGNAGTNSANNFFGTTDSQAVVIRTNNIEKMRITTDGNIGVGTSTPTKKLQVIGQGLFSDTITAQKNISVAGNIDVTQGFLNMTGTGISPFINITGNQNGWPRIVITNVANTASAGAGSLYLNNAGHMLQQYIGSSINAFTPAGALIRSNGPGGMGIVADSGAIAFGKDAHMGTNEFARFLTNGNFGIGTQTPAYKLDVNGKLGVRSVDSTASATNILYQDAATGEIKKAAFPVKQSFAQSVTKTVTGDDEATVIASGAGSLTIPAAAWFAGKTYRITIKGFYSTDPDNPAGIGFKIKLGATVIAQSTGTWLGGNHVDIPYEVQVEITCRATGASGAVVAMGTFNTGDQHLNNINNGPNEAAIDLSANQTLDITAKLSDGAAGNKISALIVLLEAVN